MNDETEVEKEVIKIIQDANKRGRKTYGKGLDYRDKIKELKSRIKHL